MMTNNAIIREEYSDTKISSNKNNIILINHTVPGVFSDKERSDIRKECQSCIGVWNGSIQHIIECHADMHADVIIEAIYRTGLAPRPSGAYLAHVLRSMSRAGVHTIDDLCAYDERHGW